MEDFWKGALGVLGTVAPMLATAVGGPLAGTAVTALIGCLGLPAETTEQKLAATIAVATPDQLIAIKKADADFAVQMAALKITADKLCFDDRASARVREAAVKDTTPRNLAYLAILGSLALAGALMLGVTHIDTALGGVVLGYVFAESKAAMAYYFGASPPDAPAQAVPQ